MGEVKTITRVPVRAVALMGAIIEAVLGLISGIITAISIDVAQRFSYNGKSRHRSNR